MRVAICDDEQVQCQLLTKQLHEWAKEQSVLLEVVPFCNAESFLFHWEDDKKFDLLVLDIEMGELSGMELAKKLRKEGEHVPILFVTGYEYYMAQGYDVEALHYLLKPLKREKLFEVMQRLQKSRKTEEKVLFQAEEGKVFLLPSEIWVIEAMAHQCRLTTVNNCYELKCSISDAKSKFQNEPGIIAVHRSFLVNLRHVSSIMKSELVMDNGMRIPLSRSKSKEVNKAFIKYYC